MNTFKRYIWSIIAFFSFIVLAVSVWWYFYSLEPICHEGIVLQQFVSDRVLYKSGAMSDNWDKDGNAQYYLVILENSGRLYYKYVGAGERGHYYVTMSIPGTFYSCLETKYTNSPNA